MLRRIWIVVAWVGGCTGDGTDPAVEGSEEAGTAAADDGGSESGPGDGGSTGNADSGSSEDGSDGSSGGWVEIDCSDVCSDPSSDAGIAVCYACRCKNAMDGYLPSPEELQCSQAEELTIYTTDKSGGTTELVPVTGDSPSECVNPALLYETCGVGSRLGQKTVGDVHVKWVCRDPYDGGSIFSDVGVIMHNNRTGASCWFDDVDNVTTHDNIPDLDLMESDQANLDAYLERFYFTDGESCTRDCHGADPFIFTPYFDGITWQTGPWVTGAHGRVTLEGDLVGVDASHLLSPEVTPCATCHRVGSTASCDFLGPQAVGTYKTAAHEQAVVDALDPMSDDWWLALWMPNTIDAITTRQAWDDAYGAAQARIADCCENPGVPTDTCLWEPIPGPE